MFVVLTLKNLNCAGIATLLLTEEEHCKVIEAFSFKPLRHWLVKALSSSKKAYVVHLLKDKATYFGKEWDNFPADIVFWLRQNIYWISLYGLHAVRTMGIVYDMTNTIANMDASI